jgi:peptidoglycan/LPS O-acetylase OafA/YrhL
MVARFLSSLPVPQAGLPQRTTIAHLPALDGLRGLAVIGVLFFHDDRLRGGYLGVDLFFVLSGFLITSLLVAEQRKSGRIDLRAFWIRRARRLFPAVLAILPAVALYAAVLARPGELGRIRGDAVATLAYFANWRSIFAGKSYWDLFNAPSPLEHTWSLAIEEQFYVVWPLLAFFVLRRSRGSARPLLVVSLGLAALSAVAMGLLFTTDNPSRAYLGTDTRGAAILVGAALACVLGTSKAAAPGPEAPWRARALDLAGLIAAVGLGVAWVKLDGQSPFLYRGGFWLTEGAVLILIACAAQGPKSLVARAFSITPLRWAGLVSYGVYLWHWPLFVVLTRERVGLGGWGLTALRLGATFAVAVVSYRFLEQPIRKHGITFGRPIVVVPAATAAAVLCIVLATRGATLESAVAVAGVPGPAVPPSPGNSAGVEYADIRALAPASVLSTGTLRVLVVGDSVAVALGDRLRFVQSSGNAAVAVRALGDCSILDEQLVTRSLNNRRHDGGDCDAQWAADVAELHPDVVLVVLGGGFFAPVEIDGKWQSACEAGWHEAYLKELTRQVKMLAGQGGRVAVARVPYPVGHWASEKWNRATDCFNAMLGEVAAAVPGVVLLPLKEQICPGKDDESCVLVSQGAQIRPDGMHFEGLGGEEIARWVLTRLR